MDTAEMTDMQINLSISAILVTDCKNYCQDMNLMHPLICALRDNQEKRRQFADNAYCKISKSYASRFDDYYFLLSLSARELAEAYLKTLNITE